MQAKGKAQTARLWSYVRDERPWCGQATPCAWYQFSVDRKGEHPSSHLKGYKGVVHADGFTGFNGLFGADRASEQACMVHVRRKFVDIYESEGSAIAEEAIKRIAALYAVEKQARYQPAEERVALRQGKAKPVFDDLEAWLSLQLPKLDFVHYAAKHNASAMRTSRSGGISCGFRFDGECWKISPTHRARRTQAMASVKVRLVLRYHAAA